MAKRSAGFLLYRRRLPGFEVLLVHPGGPFWARRDAGAWSIPKGEHAENEDPFTAAGREFAEELGAPPPSGAPIDLGECVQKGGKRVRGYALEGDLDAAAIQSNLVTIPWPPRSGRTITVPEIDRAEWFSPNAAREKLVAAQAIFVDRLAAALEAELR